MKKPLENPLPIIDPVNATVLGFRSVYEEGDEWKKVVGCEGCETRCCTNCPALTPSNKCSIHMDGPTQKRLQCIVWPRPSLSFPGCQQMFECVAGSKSILGKFRRVGDAQVRFRDEGV